MTRIVIVVLYNVTSVDPPLPAWLMLVELGTVATTSALCAHGAAELARSRRGAVRIGLWIAVAGWGAEVALPFLMRATVELRSELLREQDPVLDALYDVWYVAGLMTIAGLVIAIFALRRRAIALTCIGFMLATHVRPFAWGWLTPTYRHLVLVDAGIALVHVVIIAVLIASLGANDVAVPDRGRVAQGLRRAARALRFRGLAVVIGFGVFAVMARHHSGTGVATLITHAVVVGALINAATLGWFALGALGASAGMARYPLVLAGAMALWSGAIALAQGIYRYVERSLGDRDSAELAVALPFAVPVVAIVGLAIVLTVIRGFAARRRRDSLAQDTVGIDQLAAQYWPEKQRRTRLVRDLVIITLMLAGAAIQAWNMRSNYNVWTDHVSDSTLKLAFLAAACSLAGLILAARPCREAAEWLEAEPGLPTARVIEPR